MHDSSLAFRSEVEPAFLEHLEHWGVARQDLCDQFLDTATSGNRSEVAHQPRADALALVLVNDGESDLSLPRLDDDITSAADDHWSPLFFHHCDQGYVIDEVNI